MQEETYLGDGLYARMENGMIRLRAPRGWENHFIYLDGSVLGAFMQFVDQARAKGELP